MDIALFSRGLLLGFSIAAVVGPIALLCLRRSLTSGFGLGFVSGLGAATADATYAAVASFGVSVLSSALVEQRVWLRLVGGALLLSLGLRTLQAQPAEKAAEARGSGLRLAGAYSSTLALTLSNPMTILSFAAIFAGIGTGSFDLVIGVFIGSGAWWLVLTGAASRLRTNFTPRRLRLVNLGSGALIVAFGVQSIAAAVMQS
jgi:threonine/homoserine/homoserine lactone efflux protein